VLYCSSVVAVLTLLNQGNLIHVTIWYELILYYKPSFRKKKARYSYSAEVPKLWGPPGGLFALGGASCLYEGRLF
jgi:hypothetical protein